jgi:hypothetical protein
MKKTDGSGWESLKQINIGELTNGKIDFIDNHLEKGKTYQYQAYLLDSQNRKIGASDTLTL